VVSEAATHTWPTQCTLMKPPDSTQCKPKANGRTGERCNLLIRNETYWLRPAIASPLFLLLIPQMTDPVQEQRSQSKVTWIGGTQLGPEGVAARNPAFDVTPASLITALFTERGVARPPSEETLRRLATTIAGKSDTTLRH